MTDNTEYRLAKNTCYCRSCDKEMRRNVDWGIFMSTFRNCGQKISICKDCVFKMHKLILDAAPKE